MSSYVINKQEYIKAGGFFAGLADQRITPACAGKRRFILVKSVACRDHPRLRGEKGLYTLFVRSQGGSPPLARGKVSNPSGGTTVYRITPACAGKSIMQGGEIKTLQDHPRLRGEKRILSVSLPVGQGSPPLARGKGALCFSKALRQGITPACAGKSG